MNPAQRWSRRSVLSLGLVCLAAAAVPAGAAAADVTVGDLAFRPPDGLVPAPAPTTYGAGWQWAGSAGEGSVPRLVVLARADLASDQTGEVLGLVLAGSAAGLLPDLAIEPARVRAMPGGGEQARVEVVYRASAVRTYHGTLLIGVRSGRPAALLAVLGDGSLTAGTIDAVLESARWRR